jgi:hypothetical protein
MDFIRLAEQFVAKDTWMDPSTKTLSHDPTIGPSTGRKRIPEIWSDHHLATAKNDYKCNHCDKPIKSGDKYFRWEWKTGNPVRSHESHRSDPSSMTKGLDSAEALELLKDLPAKPGKTIEYRRPEQTEQHSSDVARSLADQKPRGMTQTPGTVSDKGYIARTGMIPRRVNPGDVERLPVKRGEPTGYKFEGLNKAEVKGERTPDQIHSAGKVVNIPGDNLGPLERAQKPALELKPGALKKAMAFIEKTEEPKKIDAKEARKDSKYQGYLRALGIKKDLSEEGQKQLRNTTAREQRIKDWALPEYEKRERDQARREARKHKQSMRGM